MSIMPGTSEQGSPDSNGDPLANFTTKLLENELVYLRRRRADIVAPGLLSKVAVAYANKDEKAFWAAANAYDSTELVEPLTPLSTQALARVQELEEAFSIFAAKLASRSLSHRTGVVGELPAEYIFGD